MREFAHAFVLNNAKSLHAWREWVLLLGYSAFVFLSALLVQLIYERLRDVCNLWFCYFNFVERQRQHHDVMHVTISIG